MVRQPRTQYLPARRSGRGACGDSCEFSDALNNDNEVPGEFKLHQNMPNPFNPETNIQFDIAENSHVRVSVFNLVGQKVASLVNGQMNSGIYHITWNGLSDKGETLPSGMYFYELKTDNYQSVKKLILVK